MLWSKYVKSESYLFDKQLVIVMHGNFAFTSPILQRNSNNHNSQSKQYILLPIITKPTFDLPSALTIFR